MKNLRMIGAGALLVLALVMLATENYAQQTLTVGELIFEAYGLNEDESVSLTLKDIEKMVCK